MVSTTKIEWTDRTWNPVRGCSRVSDGCTNCYAMGQAHRFSGAGKPFEGLTTIRRGKVDWTGSARFVPEMLGAPLRWKKPQKIFVNSMSDLFHESLSNEEIAAVFGVMAACPQHTFQVLTKRPARARAWFESFTPARLEDGAVGPAVICGIEASNREADVDYLGLPEKWPLPNVWLGCSVEDQRTLDERVPQLLRCDAARYFISAEPLLGPLDLRRWLDLGGCCECDHRAPKSEKCEVKGRRGWVRCSLGMRFVDWVIVGGESGPGARPFDIAWARSVVEQCAATLGCGTTPRPTPVFVKQVGSLWYDSKLMRGARGSVIVPVDSQWEWAKKADKKGGDPDEWPHEIRVRQFPEVRS